MHEQNQFEVTVRRKIPYLTQFLFVILITCILVFLIVEFLFIPVKNTSTDIKSLYFILVIPGVLKKALLVSAVTFVVVFPVYLKFRLHRDATLTFLAGGMIIKGKHIDISMPAN